ncbi:cytochrome c oxidase subunit 6A, mitochondrial-like [Littorina saxatilis]|uniref:Cytochrome c oxidase subunit n=1 Tax=Littorina saxatilis TaxID=31220 RepID=A0AAN9FWY4_9CAEN
MASRLSNALTRRLYSVQGPSAVAGEHHGASKRWKLLSALVALPGVAVCWINAFVVNAAHPEQPEFRPYPHLRLRTKKFPWGDGNHSLFHNAHLNPLPDGYEDSDH